MTNYQKRMTKLVWVGNVYLVGAPVALWYFSLPTVAWFVYVSTLLLLYCLAVGLDAVYDSLRERMDE